MLPFLVKEKGRRCTIEELFPALGELLADQTFQAVRVIQETPSCLDI